MAQSVGRSPATTGYRIRRGNVIALVAMPYQTGLIASGDVRVVYDDGDEDDLFPDPNPTTTSGTTFLALTKQAAKDGWITGGAIGLRALTGTASQSVRGYGQILIVQDKNANVTLACVGQGVTGAFQVISVGQFQAADFNATWVFQGTVAEDATGGTHVCSLTVVPGAGNEMQFLYGSIVVGNTATAQTPQARIEDVNGGNVITHIFNPETVSNTTAVETYVLPGSGQNTAALLSTDQNYGGPVSLWIISGAMALRLIVSTTAISVTQTFAVACRIKGAIPTATLADSVGTPVLTTNTNTVFG